MRMPLWHCNLCRHRAAAGALHPDHEAAAVRLVPPGMPLRPPHTTIAGGDVARLVRSVPDVTPTQRRNR